MKRLSSLGIPDPLARIFVWLLGCALVSAAIAIAPLLGFVVILTLLAVVVAITGPMRRRR